MAPAVDGSLERPLVTCMLLAGDRDPETRLAGLLPYVPAAVPCIAHDTLGSALGTAWPTPFDGTGLHARFEDYRLVSWPWCQDAGHQWAAPFSPQVDCGAETAPAPASGFGL
jgi:hypothetical protein